MLIGPTEVELALPATSWASPWTYWPAPWLLTVWSGPQPTTPLIPESVSVQEKPTVTSVLFQPLPLGPGVRVPVIVGGTVSTRTSVVWTVSELPARSTLQYAMVWLPVPRSAVNGWPYTWVGPPSIV